MSTPDDLRDGFTKDARSSEEVARRSVRSSLLLTAGNFGQAIILIIASLIIARLLGPDEYGVYSLALTLSILFSIFVDFGALYAIQRFSAFYLSKGDMVTARRMTKNAILFTLISGSILSTINFILAPGLSSFVLHRAGLTPEVELASVLVVGQSVFTAISLAFLGWGSSAYTSGMSISQSLVKLVTSPLLIILGFGVLGAILGHVLSYVLIALIGCVVLYLTKLTGKITTQTGSKAPESLAVSVVAGNSASEELDPKSTFSYFISDVKEIVRYGMPAYIGNGISQFATASFVLFLLSAFVANAAIGYYQAAYNVAQGIVYVSSAIGYALFNAFSSLDGMRADVQTPFRYSVTYVSLVLMPLVLFSIAASNPIIVTLYGSTYSPSVSIFSYFALYYLPAGLGLTVFSSFFNGIGKTKLTLVVQLTSCAFIFFLAPVLELLGFGITGVLYSLIASSSVSAIVGTLLIRRYANAHIDFQAAARIFLASDVSFLVTYLLQSVIHLPHIEALIFDFVVFFGIYLTLVPLLRALSLGDFERLRASTGSLGVVRKPLDLILRYDIYLVKKTTAPVQSN